MDTALIAAGEGLAVGSFFLFASLAINPLLLAGMAAWCGVRIAYVGARHWHYEKKHGPWRATFQNFAEIGFPVLPCEPVSVLAGEYAAKLGLWPPMVVVREANKLLLADINNFPRWLKKIMINSYRRDRNDPMRRQVAYDFGAGSSHYLQVPPTAVYYNSGKLDRQNKLHPDELAFIVGHEMAHLKHDFGLQGQLRERVKQSVSAIFKTGLVLCGVAAAVSPFNVALPLLALTGPSALASVAFLAAAGVSSYLGFAFASRVQEARADRVGAALSQRPLAAAHFYMVAHHPKARLHEGVIRPEWLPKHSRIGLLDLIQPYPDYGRRLQNICPDFRQLAGQKLPEVNLPEIDTALREYAVGTTKVRVYQVARPS